MAGLAACRDGRLSSLAVMVRGVAADASPVMPGTRTAPIVPWLEASWQPGRAGTASAAAGFPCVTIICQHVPRCCPAYRGQKGAPLCWSRCGRATLSGMEIWEDRQKNPVADEVSALVAVTGPIITGVLRSISAEVTSTFGERDKLPLKMLGRLRKEGDGDCGIAFDYAVHDAVKSREPVVAERVADALGKCGVSGGDPSSILFAIEKSGAQELISTEPSLVMDNSPVLLSEGGRPVSLREHLAAIGAAFRLPDALLNLAQSIRGLWKTELFLGSADRDQWVSAGIHMSPPPLRAVEAPRIAIVPSMTGRSDAIRLDEQKNTVICPLPHDGSFIQIFHEGWQIVQALCASDFTMLSPLDIPSPVHREVAVMEVIQATRKFAQPGLLTSSTEVVPNVPFGTTAPPATSTMITPIARTSNTPERVPEALAPAR